ncbi:MAG: NADH-quinone oxidoreductase subunit NuoK [Prevotellaceae bacterium]|jgi:NADH-quinone oxidoreductase subunit K|nr:NADH-quinone oxidoreductase subunit NuoK [Prevotellaceae bacterium]
MIPIEHYLIISSVMFFAGIYGFLTRKNLLALLISVELILNSVEINFSVFNRYLYPERMEGMFFSLFGIAISAAETAIAIAIIINVYRTMQNIDVRHIDVMKH